jgi:hypothetical protein
MLDLLFSMFWPTIVVTDVVACGALAFVFFTTRKLD